jgi:hypothetical protein
MEITIDVAKVTQLVKDHNITRAGFTTAEKSEPYQIDKMERVGTFLELVNMIKSTYTTKQRGRGINSYSLKHTVEDGLRFNYVSNATCILAFLYLGFCVKQIKKSKNGIVFAEPKKIGEIFKYIQIIKTNPSEVYIIPPEIKSHSEEVVVETIEMCVCGRSREEGDTTCHRWPSCVNDGGDDSVEEYFF